MKSKFSVALFCLILFSGLSASVSKAGNKQRSTYKTKVQDKRYKVNVSQVIPYSMWRGDKLYSVVYEYEFKNLKNIYIKELGLMPPKGKLRYLTNKREIVFMKTSGDETPMLVMRLTPAEPQGSLVIDIPEEDKFPAATRIETWYSPPSFQERALEVLNKYFTLGVRVFQKENVTYCITSYRRLDVADPEVNGEISMLVTYPYGMAGNKSSFRIQFLVRENRAQSTEGIWRYGISRDTSHPTEEFIKKLMEEFKVTK